MKKEKKDRVWEPATSGQKDFLYLLATEAGMTETEILNHIRSVADLPDPEALSKMEASFLIEQLKGSTDRERPYPPRPAARITDDTANMPRPGHIQGIRRALRDLEWKPERYRAWIRDRLKVDTLAELDRAGALSGYLQITDTLKRRN